MYDYKTVLSGLETLHRDACSIGRYRQDSVAKMIYAGEYSLGLDVIAAAYLLSKTRMPDHLFAIFEELANSMDMANDPEGRAVVDFRTFQKSLN